MSMQTSVSPRRSLFTPALCLLLAALVFAAYASTSTSVGSGAPIMPLDDAYIHFQYAHSIASGQPYAYNPGLPPTSGATSFLYPYLLAVGDVIGLRGLNLGYWAMGLGALALAASTWLVIQIAALYSPHWLGIAAGAIFALSGEMSWHFMSGMETGIVVMFALLTLDAVLRRDLRLTVIGATLLTLIRPEGGMLALIAAAVFVLQSMRDVPERGRFGLPPVRLWRREWLLLLIPVLALGAQPVVNLLMTGTAVASGNAAKSLFGMIPADMGVIIGRVWDNFVRMWLEFTGLRAAREAGYFAPLLFMPAALGLIALIVRHKRPLVGLLLIGWLIGATLAIATLDTAFWHFKRYQMPLMALFFPLAGWGIAWLMALRPSFRAAIGAAAVVVAAVLLVPSSLTFLAHYQLNAGYVVAQPLQMARWLAENTDPDAVVAVHDVGMMRYLGGRTTIDMVGLTTPGAAESWRNGPGAVGEFLERTRPDLIASYGEGHGLGLGYLQATDLYAESLASYTVELDESANVALAAETQGIYRPDWTNAERAANVVLIPFVTRYLAGMALVDSVDVADVASERAHEYAWANSRQAGGFPSEYNQFDVVGCWWDACTLMDGGRRINGEESFTLHTHPGEDVILITRLHPADAGTFDVYANGEFVSTRVIPALPGGWLEVPTLIPSALVTDAIEIRVVVNVNGDYQPYMHWAYQGQYQPAVNEGEPYAAFQDGAIELHDPAISTFDEESGGRTLEASWFWQTYGSARGDYKIFAHLLDADDAIVAQADVRPGLGALPPGNWIPGLFRETIRIDIVNVSAGQYRLMVGLYDPVTFENLMPTAGDAFGRLLIGEIEVE